MVLVHDMAGSWVELVSVRVAAYRVLVVQWSSGWVLGVNENLGVQDHNIVSAVNFFLVCPFRQAYLVIVRRWLQY
jgi:hypothetical protein